MSYCIASSEKLSFASVLDDVSICKGGIRKKSRSLSRARVADASTGSSTSPDRWIESATAKFLIFKAHFYIFFIVLVFCRFLTNVCEAQLRLCVNECCWKILCFLNTNWLSGFKYMFFSLVYFLC